MQWLNLLNVAALSVLCTALSAQTVTVNKTATANGTTIFNNVADALAIDPDVIEITDSEVYEEIFTIDNPVQIIGTAMDRPTLALVSNPAGGHVNYGGDPPRIYNAGGIVINLPETMTTGTVKLHNLIILPQKGVDPADRLRMAIENQNNNLYLELVNVLISANDGTDQPLAPDGIPSYVASFLPSHGTYNPAHTPIGGNGIVLGRTSVNGLPVYEGDGVELLFKDSIITHLRNDYLAADIEPERYPKCILVTNPYPDSQNPDPNIHRLVRVEGASVISHARVGIEMSGDLDMHSDGDRIVLIGFANQALDFTGPAVNYRNIEDVNITSMGQLGMWDRGHGQIRWTMRNCSSIFTLNSIIHVTGQAQGDVLIENSTLVGGRHHASAGKANVFNFSSSTNCNITVRDSILGGKMSHSMPELDPNLADIRNNNVFAYLGNNHLTLDHTALIGEGPYAFRLSETGEFLGYEPGPTATRTGESITYADPLFVNIAYTDPLNPDLLDVQNFAYATASSTGGPLSGGGDYVGVSSVTSWSLY